MCLKTSAICQALLDGVFGFGKTQPDYVIVGGHVRAGRVMPECVVLKSILRTARGRKGRTAPVRPPW